MNSSLLVILVLPALAFGYTCDSRTNGNYEISCRSYLSCENGKATLHNCYQNSTYFSVYNSQTGQCDDPQNVLHPCGIVRDCSGKKDNHYPDLEEQCRSLWEPSLKSILNPERVSLFKYKASPVIRFPKCFAPLRYSEGLFRREGQPLPRFGRPMPLIMGTIFKNPQNVLHPCGIVRDCSGKKDNHYPDLEERCRSYYTCFVGKFFGHNFCPKGLVFDSELQTCNWEAQVLPPCGTKVTSTTKP